ncbi:MAG: MFS transporter [Prevotella sp.]|nr:MFS transporter [Prevotella sp.]
MMMGYVFWDIASPLSTTLKAPVSEGGMGWTSAEYGFYAGSYSIFNIFLLMLFFGGIILDKAGIRFTGILATGMMLVGAFVNYYSIANIVPTNQVHLGFTFFGLIPSDMKLQVLVSALGFGLFGVGCDITGITISKIVTKWFTGHELASAMGIQVAMARLGTASAISFSPLIATSYGISAPLLVGTLLLLFGFVLFVAYIFMDKRFDRRNRLSSNADTLPNQKDSQSLSTVLKGLVLILRNPGFWMIALLCVFFYSSIRPFMKFATDILVNKYGIMETTAGWIVSILPYGTIVLTPLFGSIYDRIGRGATLMLVGCLLVTVGHFLMALPIATTPWVAAFIMFLHGIAFSLVPSALWPSVPKIVPLSQLGTAYSIIYYIQNLGLMLVPMLVGNIIDNQSQHAESVTHTMLFFTLFGVLAVAVSILLLLLDRKLHYGLEQANIKRHQ